MGFAENVKAWRLYRKFSVYELARASGVYLNKIYRVETGKHKTMGVEDAVRVARALGTTVEELVLGKPPVDKEEEMKPALPAMAGT